MQPAPRDSEPSDDPEPYNHSEAAPEVRQPQWHAQSYEQQYQHFDKAREWPQDNSLDAPAASDRQQRRICGLTPAAFWLLVALVTVVVMAAAVGGGVGGSMAHENNLRLASAQSAAAAAAITTAAVAANNTLPGSATTTATGSNGVATVSVTVTSIVRASSPTSDCPQYANQDWSSNATSLSYTRYCKTNLDPASWRQNYYWGIVLTFEDCINLCDSYNFWRGTKNITTINYNTGGEGGQAIGSCWCTQTTPGKYNIINDTSYDSAWLKGTYSSVPRD